MNNLLDPSRCPNFTPTFEENECLSYSYAEDAQMNPIKGVVGFCNKQGGYRCIADTSRSIPLSHSTIGTFETCHFLCYLQKFLGIETRPPFLSIPLKAGKLWDVIKQKMLGGDVNINAVINEYEIDKYTVARVRAIYKAYKELEIQVDPGRELQAEINMEFELELDLPFELLYRDIEELESGIFAQKVSVDGIVIDLHEISKAKKKFNVYVRGFYDGKYENYFTEDKLTSRPEMYLDPYFLSSQVGTYFLADSKMEKVIMEIVRFPQQKNLKENKGRDKESPEELTNRIYQDILSRPSNYFIGYNKEKKRYGKVYYKGEFGLEDIKSRYKQITLEILLAQITGIYWKNDRACNNILPGITCDYSTICKTGTISNEIYRIREK